MVVTSMKQMCGFVKDELEVFFLELFFFLPANIILQQKWNNTAVSQKEGGGTFSSS